MDYLFSEENLDAQLAIESCAIVTNKAFNKNILINKKNKIKKPINAKNLMSVLQNYYKNDPKHAEDLTKHIMENREEQIKETIRRKIDKS